LRREYPDSPVAGVAAVVFSGESVLLVRRGNEPSRGRWGLPGGVVELGEGVEEAVVREVGEETGVTVRPTRLLTVFDSIVRDEGDEIRFHYVLCEYLCEAVEGEPRAATDVSDAVWAPIGDLESMDMTLGTRRFIEKVWAGDYPA
jgi:ADP-ribose pyrophosphatase YjhB (NUDIX family)